MNEEFVSSLFQAKAAPKGPLVQEVGAAKPAPSSSPIIEEKTMMELMMEAQLAAKKEKDNIKGKQAALESKAKPGSGFKAGFLSNPPKAAAKPTVFSSSSSNVTSANNDGIVTLSKPKASTNLATNKNSPKESLVLGEVQEAMRADEASLLGKLKTEGRYGNSLLTNFAYLLC
jgi:hypothetical protein